MLNQLLDDDVRKKPFETYGILSPEDRIKLLNRYEESNQKLAREYLNRSDGRLFNEPWPNANDAWVPYEGLNVARLTPIITKMIYKLYARQNAIYQQQTALYRTSNTKKIKRWLSSLKKNITDRLHAGSGDAKE
jgi:hypothetical protein